MKARGDVGNAARLSLSNQSERERRLLLTRGLLCSDWWKTVVAAIH